MIVFLLDLFYATKNRFFRFLNYKKNLKSDLVFLDSLPKSDFYIESKSKILILELNNFHLELLDSIIYYFESLGYEVDVVVRIESSYQNAIKLELRQILDLLKDTSKYDFVFFNTMFLSLKTQHHIKTLANINAKYGILGIYHTISDIYKFRDMPNYKEGRFFALRKLNFRGMAVSNTLSCSKEIDIKFIKNDIATFISIGFPLYHRNFREKLYKAIEDLLKDNINNFRFILIGRNEFKDLRFKEYISFFKNPTTLELHEILKSSNPHYTFGFFDSFAHKHYLYNSTSGLRQFSLMYNLPFVINKKFGESFGFDNNNAIFYDSSLYQALKYAIKLINTDKYNNLKFNLHTLNEKLNEDSITLLQSCISKLKDNK